jgi:hypothetical protein
MALWEFFLAIVLVAGDPAPHLAESAKTSAALPVRSSEDQQGCRPLI